MNNLFEVAKNTKNLKSIKKNFGFYSKRHKIEQNCEDINDFEGRYHLNQFTEFHKSQGILFRTGKNE